MTVKHTIDVRVEGRKLATLVKDCPSQPSYITNINRSLKLWSGHPQLGHIWAELVFLGTHAGKEELRAWIDADGENWMKIVTDLQADGYEDSSKPSIRMLNKAS
jgi:hypothetical protein